MSPSTQRPAPSPAVVPEGTTTGSPFSSCASLVPSPPSSSRKAGRLPKAPVFIARPRFPQRATEEPTGSFVSDAPVRMENPYIQLEHVVTLIDEPDSDQSSITSSDPHAHTPHRTYDFDDDFPSIAASDSTHPKSRNTHVIRRRAGPSGARRHLGGSPSRDLSGTSASEDPFHTNSITPPSSTRRNAPVPLPPYEKSSGLTRANLDFLDVSHGALPTRDVEGKRLYAFSDDFASIPCSDATAMAPPKSHRVLKAATVSLGQQSSPHSGGKAATIDADCTPLHAGHTGSSEDVDFSRVNAWSFGTAERVSFASSLKKRISLHQPRSRVPHGDGSATSPRMSFRARGGRGRSMEDSIIKDWKQSAKLQRSSSMSQSSENPTGCASFLSKIFSPKEKSETRRELQPALKATQDGRQCTTIVEDKKMDDVHFISILAYDDFMHSPGRPSVVAKVFSRLRWS